MGLTIPVPFPKLLKGTQTAELRLGGFSKRTCVFSGIHFTRYFTEFVVVEMKQVVYASLL